MGVKDTALTKKNFLTHLFGLKQSPAMIGDLAKGVLETGVRFYQ